ncbi:MAG: S41 family peptidase [Candidatus Thermochlorobacter aerophilum]|jgi:carboxyl-terminal processing protease|uniref:S41 family peptidase n=1 Tax=Candidatus Thermochlorobacter aerophilus TaxID=1868324 RepID=A0A395M046_9BACT|nr:MAG: S41 family peptidase [Candidatus Thermochlorobacter aerophilum]
MKKRSLVMRVATGVAIVAVLTISAGFIRPSDTFFEVAKNIELLGKVYREIALNYVDEISVSEFMRAGIDGMLATLDPYTVFMDEEQSEDVEQLTTGKYAGIGVTIGTDRDGNVVIYSITDGYSAQKAGMRIGDKIVKINGIDVRRKEVSDVRALIKGEPNTEVRITVEREGERQPIEFTLIRREIQIKNVTFAGLVDDETIGYIKLERFSVNAANEVADAIRAIEDSAKAKGKTLQGMVLDLRGNPGGLLDAAVNVASKFVEQGSVIVTTKGRDSLRIKNYTSSAPPLLKDLPLAVLINSNSASASEIVAGAIQDLDRGIIVGMRSFGKGLVQTITRLPYNTSLKITTAKYYTPSGRLIQEVDYFHRNKREGKRTVFVNEPDTVRHAFKTKAGRIVYDGGGIAPDIEVPDETPSVVELALYRRSAFFRFANQYQAKHPVMPKDFKADDKLFAEFKAFLDRDNFSYDSEGERKMAELLEIAAKYDYQDDVRKQIQELQTAIAAEKEKELIRQKSRILSILEREILTRYHGDSAGLQVALKSDRQLKAAIAVLKDQKKYKAMLAAGHQVGSAVTPRRTKSSQK